MAEHPPLTLDATQQAAVLTFINMRPEYVTALKNTPGGEDQHDYFRWSGHAEARRQLATTLGLTVPHHVGERAEPAVAKATIGGRTS